MSIRTPLMKHQKLILGFIKDLKYAAIFADYGTGKTLCTLSWIDLLKYKMRKILVVSSKTSILSTWPDEIRKHTNFKYVHLLGTVSQKIETLRLGLRYSYKEETVYSAESKQPVIFLINFEGVRNIFNVLSQVHFDAIVVDESTKIKSPRAIRTKVLWALGRTVDRRIIMTGFPITENLSEIYSQIKFLDFGKALGNSFHSFLDINFFRSGLRYIPKHGHQKKIFNSIKQFAIRVTNDVLALPPQVYQKKVVEPTDQQKKLLDNLRNYFLLELGKVKIDTQYVFALINKALQICDGFVQSTWYIKVSETVVRCEKCKKRIKIDEDKKLLKKSFCPYCRHEGYREVFETSKDELLLDIVDEINPEKNKIIIWSMFLFSVSKIAKLLHEKGYNVLTLTGATDNVNAVVKKFQNSKDHNILIATQKKASESITLTSCRYAIYYSSDWSNDLRGNSEARIRRKGSEKHKSIIYTDIVMNDPVSHLVYDSLRKKKRLIDVLKKEFKTITMKGEKYEE